jgi:hypothetical protein
VYVWIWHRLPGNVAAKLAGCLVLLVGVCALLFFLLFPWVEPRLPFNDVTVDPGPSQSSPAGASATPTP